MKQVALLCDDSKAAMKGIGDSTTWIRGKYVWDMGVWRPRITLPARKKEWDCLLRPQGEKNKFMSSNASKLPKILTASACLGMCLY